MLRGLRSPLSTIKFLEVNSGIQKKISLDQWCFIGQFLKTKRSLQIKTAGIK